ncbi:hypothetical protein VTK26DRAFT_4267 [Humicola hyalothermophila]
MLESAGAVDVYLYVLISLLLLFLYEKVATENRAYTIGAMGGLRHQQLPRLLHRYHYIEGLLSGSTYFCLVVAVGDGGFHEIIEEGEMRRVCASTSGHEG